MHPYSGADGQLFKIWQPAPDSEFGFPEIVAVERDGSPYASFQGLLKRGALPFFPSAK